MIDLIVMDLDGTLLNAETKEVANFVCQNNNDDGVAKWIKENCLI
jgi:hydroxymethylpyrimidine pyrophosphatase-like HAD family hydrolase